MGDILLPEGRTVADLLKEALIKAFRESGYKVVTAQTDAKPLEVDVRAFWAWFSPGLFTVATNCVAEVKVTGDVPGFNDNAAPATASFKKSSLAATSGLWLTTLNGCLKELIDDVKSRLASGDPKE